MLVHPFVRAVNRVWNNVLLTSNIGGDRLARRLPWAPTITTPPPSSQLSGSCPRPAPAGSAGSTTTAGAACSTCTSAARTSSGTPPSGSTGRSVSIRPTCMEAGDEICPIYGSRQWNVLSEQERAELSHHLSAWLFSQFLHGEQGALTVAARIVQSVPDMDSKFYAATQAMDEARHVELFARFMREKIGLYYPVNPDLAKLLADALSDSRWDMPYLGHAGADRGPGPGRVRRAPGHRRTTRWSRSCSRTSCRTRRGTWRSGGWRCATTTPSSPRPSGPTARSSSSRAAT